MAAEEAKKNLDTFWLVGVVEQYQGFMAVLQEMMDPFKRCVVFFFIRAKRVSNCYMQEKKI